MRVKKIGVTETEAEAGTETKISTQDVEEKESLVCRAGDWREWVGQYRAKRRRKKERWNSLPVGVCVLVCVSTFVFARVCARACLCVCM